MVGLAVLNLALVTQSVLDRGSVNTGVLVTASLQASDEGTLSLMIRVILRFSIVWTRCGTSLTISTQLIISTLAPASH